MNVKFDKIDDLNATIIIDIDKADYEPKVGEAMKKLQKQVVLKGFRPGKAPSSVVNKMYGKSVLADELNNMASQKLNEYIKENKLDILGYPMSSEKIESNIDLENGEDFSFAFDLGLAPVFDLNISTNDTLELPVISVDEEEITKDINHARERAGSLELVEEAEKNDIIYAKVTELNEDGSALEGGIADVEISFVAEMIKDQSLQNQFIGIKNNTTVNANLKAIFNNVDTVIANTLNMKKEGVADLNDTFAISIFEIKRRIPAELNQEYYNQMFGEENAPTTEEEYRQKIKENLERYYANEAQMWLDHQIGHLIIDKHALALPDEFLKRWLLISNEKEYTPENIEERYAKEKEALIRRLIIEKIAEKAELKVEQKEIIEEASIYYVSMYRQYGYNATINDPMIQQSVSEKLKESEFVEQMQDRVIYKKAYDHIRTLISLKEKKYTVSEYFDMVNHHKH